MKNLLLFIFGVCSFSLMGQITITKDDLPQAGTSYYRSTALGTNLDMNETGPNYTWDYSNLNRNSLDTLTYDKVIDAPFLYQFQFNNPLQPAYRASEARWTPDIDLGGFLSLTNNYLFSKQTNSQWTEVGIGTTISGIPLPSRYSDIKTKLKLPLNYGDNNSDHYEYLINIPSIGATGQEGILSYEVDGWGTMKLPGGNFQVLRVKTTTQKSDTVYIDLLGFGVAIPSTEIVYEWYAKGEGFPVLTVNTQFGLITSVIFSDNLVNSVSENLSKIQLAVYPNPSSEVLYVNWNQPNYSVDIYDVTGTKVYSSIGKPSASIDIRFLSDGIYYLQAKSDHQTEIVPFVKQR